jgi:ubiquinone/menaquinone biosynthesis C-methylase UbiE
MSVTSAPRPDTASKPLPSIALSDISPEQFAAAQTEMTKTWFQNLLKSGKNVEAHIAGRKAAYLMRWKEAGRYIGAGARILDIGGGYLYEDLLTYFHAMNWDYWYSDVGEQETTHARDMAQTFGFDPQHFSTALNHQLDYPDDLFDAVFSSHCIEHSMNLKQTLRQLNRILRPLGELVVSIPFGWDPNPNHPYFLLENEWLALIEDAGFRIRAYQIGSEYPESGHDLMIAAQKNGIAADYFRIEPDNFVKSRYQFHSFCDPAIRYDGSRIEKHDHVILEGGGWGAEITLEAGVREILPLFFRHTWSGIVRVESGPDAVYGDLYRPHPVIQPLRLRLSEPCEAGRKVKISPVGKNETSYDFQAVIAGYMTG